MEYKSKPRPPFIVATDKADKFLAQKRDSKRVAERKMLVAMFRTNNTEEEMLNRYFRLLSEEMVQVYGISAEQAAVAIRSSAIQRLVREHPEYVDHVSLSDWAKEVYTEYLGS